MINQTQYAVNKKYAEKHIDLAVEGWCLALNTPDPKASLDRMIRKWKPKIVQGRLETRIEDIAYTDDGVMIPGFGVIYVKGIGIEPSIPTEVINVASGYLSRSEASRLPFLLDVYKQIFEGKDGNYAQMFKMREIHISAILNYFADKLRAFKFYDKAIALESKIKEQFPHREIIKAKR